MTETAHYTLHELLDAGVPRTELIDAIARGQLGPVIAGHDHDTTLVARSKVVAWLAQQQDAPWSGELRLPSSD
jgi:hypothetical protein